MKKSLVLAMAMALGVTASAYAANPFSDVPAGHWAYDSISKLAAAGVIEGYGDDTFRGDRLMTRYEMAQIVAKAMAKGANVEKLAAEFADELDALGVRVAALEKKSDNVKITGQVRYRWAEGTPIANNRRQLDRRRTSALRTRLTLNGQVNDSWKYTALIQNQENFTNDRGEENTDFQRAFVTGRIGGVRIVAGRTHFDSIGAGEADVYSNRYDRVVLSYGDKFKVSGWYGKPASQTLNNPGVAAGNMAKGAGARISYDWDKFGLAAEYNVFAGGGRPNGLINGSPLNDNNKWDILGIAANGKFGDFGLDLVYLHGKQKNNNRDLGKNGFNVNLSYKGAKANKPGSWGIGVKYYNQGALTFLPGQHATDAYLPTTRYAANEIFAGSAAGDFTNGFTGFKIQADYTAAKNMVASIMYFDLKEKTATVANRGKAKAKTALAQMIWTF